MWSFCFDVFSWRQQVHFPDNPLLLKGQRGLNSTLAIVLLTNFSHHRLSFSSVGSQLELHTLMFLFAVLLLEFQDKHVCVKLIFWKEKGENKRKPTSVSFSTQIDTHVRSMVNNDCTGGTPQPEWSCEASVLHSVPRSMYWHFQTPESLRLPSATVTQSWKSSDWIRQLREQKRQKWISGFDQMKFPLAIHLTMNCKRDGAFDCLSGIWASVSSAWCMPTPSDLVLEVDNCNSEFCQTSQQISFVLISKKETSNLQWFCKTHVYSLLLIVKHTFVRILLESCMQWSF